MKLFSKNSKNKKVEEKYINEREEISFQYEKEENFPSGNLIFNFINLKAEVEEMVLFYDDGTITDLDIKPEKEKKCSRMKYFKFLTFTKKQLPDKKSERINRLKKNLTALNEIGVSDIDSEILITELNGRQGGKHTMQNNSKCNSSSTTHTVLPSKAPSRSFNLFKQISERKLMLSTEKYLDVENKGNDDVKPWEGDSEGDGDGEGKGEEGEGEGEGSSRKRHGSMDNERSSARSGKDGGRELDRSRGSKRDSRRSRDKDRETEKEREREKQREKERERGGEKGKSVEQEDEYECDSFSLRISSHHHSLKPSLCASPSVTSSPSPSIDSTSYGRGRKHRRTVPDRHTDFPLPLHLSLPSSMIESDHTVRQSIKSYPKSSNSENHNNENSMDTEFERLGNLKIYDVDIDDCVITEYRWKNEEKVIVKSNSDKEKEQEQEQGNIDTFQVTTSLKKPFSPTKKHTRSMRCVIS